MDNKKNKKTMARNINYYMSLYGKTRVEMCQLLGVKYTTFTDWVKGNSYPRIDKIELMANYFNISKSDLIENKQVTKNETHTTTGVIIKVFDDINADMDIDNVEDIVDTEEIPKELATTGEFFGLKVNDDSMSPRILDGDTIIVRQQSDADSGDIVLVQIDDERPTCKQLMKSADGISLISFNPTYPPVTFSNKEIKKIPVVIIGRVVECRAKF